MSVRNLTEARQLILRHLPTTVPEVPENVDTATQRYRLLLEKDGHQPAYSLHFTPSNLDEALNQALTTIKTQVEPDALAQVLAHIETNYAPANSRVELTLNTDDIPAEELEDVGRLLSTTLSLLSAYNTFYQHPEMLGDNQESTLNNLIHVIALQLYENGLVRLVRDSRPSGKVRIIRL
jgi:hypothetical protein